MTVTNPGDLGVVAQTHLNVPDSSKPSDRSGKSMDGVQFQVRRNEF